MANEHSGNKTAIGIAIEGTRGTAEASPDVWLPRLSGVIDDKDGRDLVSSAQGSIYKNTHSKIVQRHSEGSFEGLIEDINFGYILNALYGDAPTPDDTPEAGVIYDHAFVPLDSNLHQSLTVFKYNPVQTKKFGYCMIENLTMEFLKDQIMRFTMDVKGLPGADDTDTVSITANNLFVPKHFTFKKASAQAGLDAAGETIVERATLTFNKSLQMTWNDGIPYLIINGEMDVSGEITTVYNAETMHDLVHDDTTQALRFQLTNTDVTIGTAGNPQLTTDVYAAVFSDWSKEEPLAGLVRETVKFNALQSGANFVKSTLRNLHATAYDA